MRCRDKSILRGLKCSHSQLRWPLSACTWHLNESILWMVRGQHNIISGMRSCGSLENTTTMLLVALTRICREVTFTCTTCRTLWLRRHKKCLANSETVNIETDLPWPAFCFSQKSRMWALLDLFQNYGKNVNLTLWMDGGFLYPITSTFNRTLSCIPDFITTAVCI